MALIGAIMCGILVTWATAGFGYCLFSPPGCKRPGRSRVQETRQAITSFMVDHNRCPNRDNLIDQKYVSRGALVDPWGTSITFHCLPSGDVVVRSAGADRLFHTEDDITNGEI